MHQNYTEQTIVSFGIHQRKPLGKVPASYLLWMYESQEGITNPKLLKYVEDNYSRLEHERNNPKKMNKKILILDLETTGFLQKGGKIVEIGIVSLDLENGEKEILFDSMCKEPGMTLIDIEESWIVKNSDMNPLEAWNAPMLEDIRLEVQGILSEYTNGATAYNNAFDFGFMEDRGFTFPRKLKCPMKLATDVCKIPSPRGGYKWPKVQEAWDFLFGETDYIEKHRGADDAFHEADIVYELYKRKIFK